jgi:hypothetical protein
VVRDQLASAPAVRVIARPGAQRASSLSPQPRWVLRRVKKSPKMASRLTATTSPMR